MSDGTAVGPARAPAAGLTPTAACGWAAPRELSGGRLSATGVAERSTTFAATSAEAITSSAPALDASTTGRSTNGRGSRCLPVYPIDLSLHNLKHVLTRA